jgi:alpha-tubulin suppressor-like RCC1 family protein
VKGLASDAVAIIASGQDTCALLQSGAMQCWGDNYCGQLGDGTTISRTTAVYVRNSDNTSNLANVVAITGGAGNGNDDIGGSHICALLQSGAVQCWGSNRAGELGDANMTDSYLPVDVRNLDDTTNLLGVVGITGGALHTCALLQSGAMQCWGDNYYGQLGNGSTINSNIPVTVKGLTSHAVAITAGNQHTCALLQSGAMQCWGYNQYGQLGDGSSGSSPVTSPVTVKSLTNAVAITAGGYHTCALINPLIFS